MAKYILHINEERDEPNASSKARNDAEIIAIKSGFIPYLFNTPGSVNGRLLSRIQLLSSYWKDWKQFFYSIEENSYVLIQYPLFPLKLSMVARHWLNKIHSHRQVSFIALVHDLDSLRNRYGKASRFSDFKFLPDFQHIICHNEKMKSYLISQNIPEQKLIELGFFDYLTNSIPKEHHLQDGIAIAGNLNPQKSGYISKLVQITEGKIPIHLYGNGIEKLDGVIYHGSFQPDSLPGIIEGAFGLAWDGPNVESCIGSSGEYLKYNSPHKVSLYLASGMPVIIWDDAALANRISYHGIGCKLKKLTDLPEMISLISDEYFCQMKRNVDTTYHGKYEPRLQSILNKITIFQESDYEQKKDN